jgi:hypothetical protein
VSSRERWRESTRGVGPRIEYPSSQRRRYVESARQTTCLAWRIFKARRHVPFLFHSSERDVNRSALQLPFRRGDELEAVHLIAVDEALENEGLFAGERGQRAPSAHVVILHNVRLVSNSGCRFLGPDIRKPHPPACAP